MNENVLKGRLILTVGLPRSGKSTWSRQWSLQAGVSVVNRDAIRLALHGRAFIKEAEPMVASISDVMVRSHFIYRPGSTLVLDECHITDKIRSRYENQGLEIRYAVFETPLEVCLARAELTNFPKHVIEDMHRDFEWPSPTDPRIVFWVKHQNEAADSL